jgi:group I intron endonuclease
MHYLYRIDCLVNGKVYIGQSVQPRKRWSQHKSDALKPKQVISHAIQKYKKENFDFIIIACCQDKEDANQIEEQLIIQYDSRNNNKGYNIAVGGSNGALGYKHSKERKRKISLALIGNAYRKGKLASDEAKQKMSIAQRGNKKNWVPTEEQRKNYSIAALKRKRAPRKICTICGVKQKAFGLCNKHYQRARKGTPASAAVTKSIGSNAPCFSSLM